MGRDNVLGVTPLLGTPRLYRGAGDTMISTPEGRAAVIETFGDLRSYIRSDGTLSPRWEKDNIRRIVLPRPLTLSGENLTVTRVTCHILLTDTLRSTLQKIDDAGKWDALHSYGGGFIFRNKRTNAEISLHAWGIAWDFDPEHNRLGTPGSMDPTVVQIFEANGFFWGGLFHQTKDPMHFQFAKNV
jgi:hypothetical protein